MKNLLLLILFFTSITLAQNIEQEKSRIYKVLQDQLDAWNAGDIPGYMSGYLQSDSLEFAGGKNITYGWKNTLERYQRSYSTREKMGLLSFEILRCEILSTEYAYVTGKWKIKRAEDEAGGTFTLLWKKVNGRWLIISDHSS